MSEPTILFENEDVVVIDKPAGLLVHEDGTKTETTVVDWFLKKYPDARGVGEPRVGKDGKEIERSGIVHRLDKDTSGVMVLCKNQPAFLHIKQQFQDRLIKKEYLALVYGHFKETWGTIDRPIGRNAKDWRLRSAERGAKGTLREAVTNWECLSNGEFQGEKFAHVKLMPQTGRMHQLRVHLKAIDHPIVGDVLYAGKRLEQSNNVGLTRLALHAHELTLVLPSDEEKTFTALLPKDIELAISTLKAGEQ
ncbi:MAG: RluA family pseudouridine synthase [Candidatus Paceibacterota bacterium]